MKNLTIPLANKLEQKRSFKCKYINGMHINEFDYNGKTNLYTIVNNSIAEGMYNVITKIINKLYIVYNKITTS